MANSKKITDLTGSEAERPLADSEKRSQAIFESALDAILIADDQGRYLDANPAACQLFGLTREDIMRSRVADFLPPGVDFVTLWQNFLAQKSMAGEIELYFPDGRHCTVEFAAKADILPHQHLSILRDISERKRIQQLLEQANRELEYLANHDKLTELANRRYCDEYLDSEWLRLSREKSPLSVILCDVDYFKAYNDSYGHLTGDECLNKIARTISTAVRRPADLVARYGGEEFIIILPNTNSTGAIDVARLIQQEISRRNIPHKASPIADRITLSYGIACSRPDNTFLARSLVDKADQNLYRAKQNGRNQYHVETATDTKITG